MSFLTRRRSTAPRRRPRPVLGPEVVTFRALRKRAGLSQQAIAHRAGRSVSLVAKIEAGAVASPAYDTAEAFAAVLGVAPGDVMTAIRNQRGGV